MKPRVAVIGTGSWATALVKLLGNNVTEVNWYVRNAEDAVFIGKYHRNPRYLSSVEFAPKSLKLFSELNTCIKDSDIIVLAVPSAFCHDVLKDVPKELFKNKTVFSAIKGIIPEYNLIVGEYLNKVFEVPLNHIGVIAGPCHAEEVALEKFSYLTLACTDITKAETLAELLRCRY